MKIAFISTYDFAIPGGVRNHILELANALTHQGHATSIIAPSSDPSITSQIPDFTEIARFPSASNTGWIPPHLLLGFRVISRLQQHLNAHAFDIVHIHEPLIPPLCLSAMLHSKSPLVATFHTYYEKGQPLYRVFQPLLNRCLQRLKGRIAVSEPAKAYIEQYFPYDYKIIPNGVNLAKFSTQKPKPSLLTAGYFNLLFVGHAQFKRKGLKYMLDAFRMLKPEYPSLRLIVAGTKWSGRACPKALKNLPLQDVLYLGTVTENDLIELYQTANIFCAPSLGNESFGMVLTEAMAAGIPIITTRIKGYARVVKDHENALMVPPKNAPALADAIKHLMHDPLLRQRLVEQGKKCVARYDWGIVANEVLHYYHDVLGG